MRIQTATLPDPITAQLTEELFALVTATIVKRIRARKFSARRAPLADLIQSALMRTISRIRSAQLSNPEDMKSRAVSAAMDEVRQFCRAESRRINSERTYCQIRSLTADQI